MLLLKLVQLFPKHKINFDLNNCDKILRIPGKIFDPKNNSTAHQRKLSIQSFEIKKVIWSNFLNNKI